MAGVHKLLTRDFLTTKAFCFYFLFESEMLALLTNLAHFPLGHLSDSDLA